MTGAAVQALVAAGRRGSVRWTAGSTICATPQAPDGGFPALPGEPESNVASTAWAVQAIWAVGENPETWLTGGGAESEEPLDFMESLQEPDGHIRWKRSDDTERRLDDRLRRPRLRRPDLADPGVHRRALRSPPSKQPGSGGEGAQRARRGDRRRAAEPGRRSSAAPDRRARAGRRAEPRVVGENAAARNHSETRHGEQPSPADRDGDGRVQRRARQRLPAGSNGVAGAGSASSGAAARERASGQAAPQRRRLRQRWPRGRRRAASG